MSNTPLTILVVGIVVYLGGFTLWLSRALERIERGYAQERHPVMFTSPRMSDTDHARIVAAKAEHTAKAMRRIDPGWMSE